VNAPGNLGSCHFVPGPARIGVSDIIVRTVGAFAAIAAVWALSDVVLVLFLAVLLACVLRGSAEYLAARTGVRDGFALAAVVLVVALATTGIGWWMVPKLAHEGYELVGRLSQEWQLLRPQVEPLIVPGNGNGPLPALGALQGRLAAPIETVFGSSLGMMTGCVVVVVTAVYLAASPELHVGGVLHLVPFPMRPRVREVLARTGQVLRLWVLGQLVDMLAVGVLAGIGLWVLGVPVPFALGVLSALLTFIPYVGAVLAAVPATLLALMVSWPTALWALGVYTLCHCVEGYLIAPNVQRRMVELPPALMLMSMTVAGALFGLLGVAVGAPLAAVGMTAVRMLYVEDVLHDDTVGAGNVMGQRRHHGAP